MSENYPLNEQRTYYEVVYCLHGPVLRVEVTDTGLLPLHRQDWYRVVKWGRYE